MLFSIVAFNILFLYFVILITMCLGSFLLGFVLFGTLHLDFVKYFFQMLGKFSAIISSNIFLGPFSLSLFLGPL